MLKKGNGPGRLSSRRYKVKKARTWKTERKGQDLMRGVVSTGGRGRVGDMRSRSRRRAHARVKGFGGAHDTQTLRNTERTHLQCGLQDGDGAGRLDVGLAVHLHGPLFEKAYAAALGDPDPRGELRLDEAESRDVGDADHLKKELRRRSGKWHTHLEKTVVVSGLLEAALLLGSAPRIRAASPAEQIQDDDSLDVGQVDDPAVHLQLDPLPQVFACPLEEHLLQADLHVLGLVEEPRAELLGDNETLKELLEKTLEKINVLVNNVGLAVDPFHL
uniref:Centromere protein H n=1 Tax=Steinernema glaseri TaxID=37863 RepID=A0A1I7ZTF4_9BILA